MKQLIASEVRKLTTLRLPWVVLVTGAMFAAAIGAIGVNVLKPGEHVSLTQIGRSVASPMWFLVMVVAVLASAAEFQYRTIRTTLLVAPRRGIVLAAKAIVAAGYGALLTLSGVLAAGLAGLVTARVEGVELSMGSGAGWCGLFASVAVGALWGVLASGLGLLTRSTAVALTALLLWRFVGEGMLPVVLRRPGMSAWTPSGVATRLVNPPHEVILVVAAALALLGYVALVAGAAATMFTRRDPA